MPRRKTTGTPKQRAALGKLRRLISERGYWIFPLAPQYIHSTLDFLAVLKFRHAHGETIRFLVVRTTTKDRVSILSWGARVQYSGLKDAVSLAEAYSQRKVVWTKREAAHGKLDDSWKKYFPPEALEFLQTQGLVF